MRIVFLCGSLEPGRDGVGDYTRRLAVEMTRQGHQCSIVSLNDVYVEKEVTGTQKLEDIDVPVLRLPYVRGGSQRSIERAKEWIHSFNPDWISLQFVIYSYDPSGLPFGLGKKFSVLGNGKKWNIMFHEIWLGETKEDTIKQKLIGRLQKRIIRGLVNDLRPSSVTSSNQYYQSCLQKLKVKSNNINVYSNLPIGRATGKALYNQLPAEVRNNRGQYIVATFFGSVHEHKDLTDKVAKLAQLVKKSGKQLLITHIGRGQNVEVYFDQWKKGFAIQTQKFGECRDSDIADYLKAVDLGLSTTPKFLFEKSGSVAAFLNNGIPVILLRNSFVPDHRDLSWVREVEEIDNLIDFISQKKHFQNNYGVEQAAKKYIELFQL